MGALAFLGPGSVKRNLSNQPAINGQFLSGDLRVPDLPPL